MIDSSRNLPADATAIYRRRSSGDELVGYVAADGTILSLQWRQGRPIGRVAGSHIIRFTAHDEREVGEFSPDGKIRSHGLFEGGALGWLEPDGVVVQGGLIFGEEETGTVAGPQPIAAAAALLLIFLPDEAESEKQMQR
jgi:hypothetical protein